MLLETINLVAIVSASASVCLHESPCILDCMSGNK